MTCTVQTRTQDIRTFSLIMTNNWIDIQSQSEKMKKINQLKSRHLKTEQFQFVYFREQINYGTLKSTIDYKEREDHTKLFSEVHSP